MPGPTLRLVAKLAGVAPVTVSRVVNGTENVAPATREKILATIRDLDCTPNIHAANIRRKRLIDESMSGSKDRLACLRSLHTNPTGILRCGMSDRILPAANCR